MGSGACFSWAAGLGGYLFAGLLDLPTAAIRVFALSLSAALWVALRWLARRFVSFALFVPRIWSSIDFAKVFSPSYRWQNELKEAP